VCVAGGKAPDSPGGILYRGADALHAAAPLGNHVRASYFDETREQVDGPLKTLHYRKIALIYPDDAFGEAVLQGVETALKANGAAPVETASYARQSNDSASAIAQVNAANPDAVVVVGPSNTVAPVLKSAHAKGWTPLFVTVFVRRNG
jgi:branched-chain amino acid transport system substrate-binding protein